MKDVKKAFKYFTIPEWQKEQDYLRDQHSRGWKFVGVRFPGLYYFEKCEPEDVIYQLDYNPEGTQQQEAYIQMFRDCGWEYIEEYVGYSYFRKSAANMQGEEGIFCDDASRVDMMKRVFKGRILPLAVIFLLVIVPNLWWQSFLDTPLNQVLTMAFSGLLLLYIALFAWFGYQFWAYWKNIRQ